MYKREKTFRDPIHGFISISSDEQKIIDSPMFQRMRNIKQLSLGHYAYHGSEHSRFGHMIGAMHLAERVYHSITNNSEKHGGVKLDEIDLKTLRISALLHDIGHSPFSHSLELLLDASHEEYSTDLIDHYFKDMIKEAGVEPNHVKNLILGENPSKPYLSKIINRHYA